MSYMKQNKKKRKQTLESAQYGLEISPLIKGKINKRESVNKINLNIWRGLVLGKQKVN